MQGICCVAAAAARAAPWAGREPAAAHAARISSPAMRHREAQCFAILRLLPFAGSVGSHITGWGLEVHSGLSRTYVHLQARCCSAGAQQYGSRSANIHIQ